MEQGELANSAENAPGHCAHFVGHVGARQREFERGLDEADLAPAVIALASEGSN